MNSYHNAVNTLMFASLAGNFQAQGKVPTITPKVNKIKKAEKL